MTIAPLDPLPLLDIVARVGAAFVLGGLLGLERERKNRPAGLRTMILVSVGCAGFIIMGHEAIRVATQQEGAAATSADISRVLQGLLGGVGFLGAGAVLHGKKAVHGLTTASAIWIAACVGAAAGLGLYILAAVLSGFALFTLIGLEYVENKYFPDHAKIEDAKIEDAKRDQRVIHIVLDRDGKPVNSNND
jgi:putative Mg2+ transporter-C (MgtC) family protein